MKALIKALFDNSTELFPVNPEVFADDLDDLDPSDLIDFDLIEEAM